MTTDSETSKEQYGQITSASVLGARLTWSFIGPAALLLITVAIVSRGEGWFTALDCWFTAVVVWMLVGRWFDHRRTSAAPAVDDPPASKPFNRYAAMLLSIAAVAWLVANVLGNHLLT